MSKPTYMLNVLWFKKDGGKEKYEQYWAGATRLLEAVGASVTKMYSPEQNIIGELDADAVFVVEYPDISEAQRLSETSEFADVKHLREEALEKSLLIKCGELDWNSNT